MPRARTLAVVVLLVLYGAVGARQPAVRTAVPLPAPARAVASAVGLQTAERSRLMLDLIRLVFDAPDGHDGSDLALRAALRQAMTPQAVAGETIPLPLDVSVWRETILQRPIADREIAAVILSDRRLALLYHGLAALDDETLAWLGPERETLHHLMRHAGAFATFGRSIRIKAGQVVVPGGPEAVPLWESLVGGTVTKPGLFVRRLFGGASGRLPFLYDTIAHLEPARQRFALGFPQPEPMARADRLRALADVFESMATDWRIEERPFSRPQIDPSLTLALVAVLPDGRLAPPAGREVWDRVFRGDEETVPAFAEVEPGAIRGEIAAVPIDAAWLTSRIHRVGFSSSRRRLDAFLYGQRMFADVREDASLVNALRAVIAYPALTTTLERVGVRSPTMVAAAAARARSLDNLSNDAVQRAATAQFQSGLAIVERAVRTGGLTVEDAGPRIAALIDLDLSPSGYDGRIASWISGDLLAGSPKGANDEVADPIEDAVLSVMAGARTRPAAEPQVQWEGRSYRVNTSWAELLRLRRIRERQGGLPLDAALAAFGDPPPVPEAATRAATGSRAPRAPAPGGRADAERALADTLMSIVYAPVLGDPEGEALSGGNVALRHEFGWTRGPVRSTFAWRLPMEQFGSVKGWRVLGSLLALDAALGRLSARRLDSGDMPAEPRLTTNERQTMFLTLALMQATAMTNDARDEIAAALGRGRARVNGLTGDREQIERLAAEAGLSEWRREALAWTVEHGRDGAMEAFSLAELMRLGAPRGAAQAALDAWGAASLPLTGCLCLAMPPARDWEFVGGRPAVGLLATQTIDMAIHVADALAALRLPASLAPGVMAFVVQEVVDRAQPAYYTDWLAVTRATRAVTRDRTIDFVAALTASGPLLPVPTDDRP